MSDTLTSIASALGSGAAASNPVSMVAKLGDDILNAIWPSPEAKASAEAVAAKSAIDAYVAKAQVDMAPFVAQSDIDKVEASNPSVFIGGWRPALGWCCVSGFAYSFILRPILSILPGLQDLPVLDSGTLMALTTGMLGLGAMHSYDLLQGTATTVLGGTSTIPTVHATVAQAAGKGINGLPWKKT